MRGESSSFEPLAGVAAVALWLAGFLVWSMGDKPSGKYEPSAIASWFDDAGWTITGGAAMFALGSAAFVWFLGCLSDVLSVDEGARRLGRVAFGCGLGVALLLTCSFAPTVAGAGTYLYGDKLGVTPDAAQAIYSMTDGFIVLAEMVGVGLVLAVALAVRRTGALPRWVGVASWVLVVLLLFLPFGFLGVLFGIPLWTVALSILLARRPVAARGQPSAAPGAAASDDATAPGRKYT